MTVRMMLASAGLLAATSFMAAPALAQTNSNTQNCETNAAGECVPELGPGSQQNAPDFDPNVPEMNTGAGTSSDENDGVEQPGGGILDLGPGSQQNAPDVDNNGTTNQSN